MRTGKDELVLAVVFAAARKKKFVAVAGTTVVVDAFVLIYAAQTSTAEEEGEEEGEDDIHAHWLLTVLTNGPKHTPLQSRFPLYASPVSPPAHTPQSSTVADPSHRPLQSFQHEEDVVNAAQSIHRRSSADTMVVMLVLLLSMEDEFVIG